MKISNRVRRNVSFAILLVGIVCIIARGWEVVMSPSSGRAWFDLLGVVFLTFICYSRFSSLQKRVNRDKMLGI